MAHVLLVDDNDSNRLTMSLLLEEDGFFLDHAASFREAQAKIAAPRARYDLVLLDQHLGDGRGTDLVALLRARMPEAKIVLVSGSIEEGDAAASLFDAVLPKGTLYPEAQALLGRLIAGGRP